MRCSILKDRPVRSISLIVAILVHCLVAGAAHAMFLAETYFPLEPGRARTYLRDGATLVTETILPGTEAVNGVATRVNEVLGGIASPGRENLTNDGMGVQFHRRIEPSATFTFSPPWQVLPPVFEIGLPIVTQGTASISGLGVFPYTLTSTVTSAAEVTVPAGTFDALALDTTLTLGGVTATTRLYLVEHIGPTRVVNDVFGQLGAPVTDDLVSVTLPEPAPTQVLLPALIAMAWAHRRARES